MKKIMKHLTGKTLFLGLFLLIQLVFVFFLVYQLAFNSLIGVYVHFIFNVFSFLIVMHLLANNDNLTYKMAWLIPVLAFPVFGTFFYIFYQSNNVSKRTIEKFSRIINNRYDLLMEHPNFLDTKEAIYLDTNGWRTYKHSSSTFLGSGEIKLEHLLEDLKKAEKFIFMEYFILSQGQMFDQIFEILIDKAKNGVEIKIIYDDLGSADYLPYFFKQKLSELNIEVISFNRIRFHINFMMNYRDHRKIVVIDNLVAYTGGINIGDEYVNIEKPYGHWQDASIRIEGSAVWSITLIFLENWNYSSKKQLNFLDYYSKYEVESDGYYIPFGDNPIENKQIARNVYLNMIGTAKREILITTPYLIFDNELLTALQLAAKSGVSVKIVIPFVPDKKLVYSVTKGYANDLLSSGVSVYLYTPGFIHSKLLVVDGHRALIGTTNLDFRSLYLHFENNIYLYKTSSIKDIEQFINDSIDKSQLATSKDLEAKGFIRKVIRTMLKGFSSLL